MKRVLITGGGGFLGLHVACFFYTKGYEVTILDIHKPEMRTYPQDTKYLQVDIRDAQKLQSACRGIDVVVHAAAALPLFSKHDIFTTNVDGTRNVLEVALKNKVKQVVYISSTAVYGVPIKHPIFENDPLDGVGTYGETKIQAEKLCEEYRRKDMLVTILRPKTFIGTHRLGVFEILFDWIKDGKPIPVIGSGNNKYQLLDVDDLVDCIYTCVDKSGAANDTFNIGAAEFDTVKKDLEALFVAAKSKSRVLQTPAVLIKLALRLFELLHISPLYKWVYETADRDSYVSIDKLKKRLRWQPKYSNTQALIKAYEWYEKHYDEIKSRGSGTTHTVGWKQGVLGIIKKFL